MQPAGWGRLIVDDKPGAEDDYIRHWPSGLKPFEVDYYLLIVRAHLEVGDPEAALRATPAQPPRNLTESPPKGMQALRLELARLGVVPTEVVYKRAAGARPSMPPCGRR